MMKETMIITRVTAEIDEDIGVSIVLDIGECNAVTTSFIIWSGIEVQSVATAREALPLVITEEDITGRGRRFSCSDDDIWIAVIRDIAYSQAHSIF